MSITVVVCRLIERAIGGNPCKVEGDYYAKSMELPLTPFVGLGIVVEKNSDPCKIQTIFVNLAGQVVCLLEDVRYVMGQDLHDENEWKSQVAYHTQNGAWMKVGRWNYTITKFPPDEDKK